MKLFEPLQLRDVVLKNRLVVAPMCQYSAIDGFTTDYHLIHLGRFALGGFAVVMVEATAVQAEGRITHGDVGIWRDEQAEGLGRIANALRANGAVPAIQLAHAGPKASMQRPWEGNGPLGPAEFVRGEKPWRIVAPTSRSFSDGWLVPHALTEAEIEGIRASFGAAARRALQAGFEIAEVHCAHGYLLNSFLSPVTNTRTDAYGGDRERRMRVPLDVVKTVREIWPKNKPIFVRVSAVDGIKEGVSIEDTIAFAAKLKELGVDVVDCSSGGVTPRYEAPTGYGHQVPYAEQVSMAAGIRTMAVGLIVDAHQAEAIVADGRADLVAIGREALADPNWALNVEATLRRSSSSKPNFDGWPLQSKWWLTARAAQVERRQLSRSHNLPR